MLGEVQVVERKKTMSEISGSDRVRGGLDRPESLAPAQAGRADLNERDLRGVTARGRRTRRTRRPSRRIPGAIVRAGRAVVRVRVGSAGDGLRGCRRERGCPRWKSITRGRWSEASRASREWAIRTWRMARSPRAKALSRAVTGQ